MNVMDYIKEYVDQIEVAMPIFTKDIYKYVESKVSTIKKNVLNEYILRYQKTNPDFLRYKKGIYYKTVDTPFGPADIDDVELYRRVYLEDDEKFKIGYETGPSLMNAIGLTTQVPAHTYVVTENGRSTILEEDTTIKILKPITKITNENWRYLQFIDILENKYGVSIEREDYVDVLRNLIKEYNLSFEKLLAYARYYDNIKVYKGLAELARE